MGLVVSPTQPIDVNFVTQKFITRGEFVMSGKYQRYPVYKASGVEWVDSIAFQKVHS